MPGKSIYTKMNFIIAALLLPLVALFMYSTHTAQRVIEHEVTSSAKNRLGFLAEQIDRNVDQLFLYANTLLLDRSLLEFKDIHEINGIIDTVDTRLRIYEKLQLQTLSSNWENKMAAYSLHAREVIATYALAQFDLDALTKNAVPEWSYRGGRQPFYNRQFVRYATSPFATFDSNKSAGLMVEVSFPDTNIRLILDQYKSSGSGGAFLYHPDQGVISATSTIAAVQDAFADASPSSAQGSMTLKLQDETEYLVQYIKLNSLGWLLVDYLPMSDIVAPILGIRTLFYLILAVLAATALLSSLLLYRKVQQPILELLKSVQRLKKGDFSVRIGKQPNNEFTLLFSRFNEMAEQIQELVETVYLEQLRLREAILKQLQSQINPHFLYNSLYMIKSMIKLGDSDAAIAMVYHLGEYYRYTTRVERDTTTLRGELELIQNYLSIHQLRMDRISFQINVPEHMLDLEIPRLLLQPIVENAVVHGIEPKLDGGCITIAGERWGTEIHIVVWDDGIGINELKLTELRNKLALPLVEDSGCGLWNVNRRLQYRYGEKSGLVLEHMPGGGVKIQLVWTEESASAEELPAFPAINLI